MMDTLSYQGSVESMHGKTDSYGVKVTQRLFKITQSRPMHTTHMQILYALLVVRVGQ